MKLFVLVDNTAGKNYQAEYGLSFLIKDDIDMLFDVGHSDLFLKNAERLNLDLDNVNNVILSHGHWDHGNGLQYLKNKKLTCHPDVFIKRYREIDSKYNGLSFSQDDIENQFEIKTSLKPVKLSSRIIFLGEIPRSNKFEAKKFPYRKHDGSVDFIHDDSAIVIDTEEGLIVISGCAHSGICNIVEYARKICNRSLVRAVIGGFHLREVNTMLMETIQYFKDNSIQKIYPSHCSSFEALCELRKHFNIRPLQTGDLIQF